MRLIINGQAREIAEAGTIAGVVGQCAQKGAHLIAELNGTIIPAPAWETTPLKDGDALELVGFVGGG